MSALLPAGLAFLMLVVGLRLTWDDFRFLWQRPRAVAAGLALQILALPLLAILISRGLALPPTLSVGLLLVAATPGGVSSNFITLLARGDAALSTTMTLTTSLAACLTVPLILIAGGAEIGSSLTALIAGVGKTALAVMAVSTLPLVLGMVLHWRWPDLAKMITPHLNRAAALIFAALVITAFFQNWGGVVSYGAKAVLAALMLNVSAIAAAFLLGNTAGLPHRQKLALAIESGLHNVAMAMFIAANVLMEEKLMIPGLIYAVIMNVSALGLLALGRRRAPAIATVSGS